MLESLLADANRLKDKFEADYLELYQKHLGLENELGRRNSEGATREA